MTDQSQTQDPQTQNDQNQVQEQVQDTGVFGGSDDIFENSDFLEPVKDSPTNEIKEDEIEENIQEISPEVVETMPEIEDTEIKSDIVDETEEKTTKIEHE